MKTTLLIMMTMLCTIVFGQTDKSKRPSPPDSVIVTTDDGVTIAIHYSSPSLKGREIGVDIVPLGQVWRTGANEATTIEVDKDVLINGEKLVKGKYSLYTLPGEMQTLLIFNKTWDQWGTRYDEAQDALRVAVINSSGTTAQEQFKINADNTGKVTLAWGNYFLPFQIKAAQ
jgi:archaellum component FlaF (FlaF/FlaG flagellin family)